MRRERRFTSLSIEMKREAEGLSDAYDFPEQNASFAERARDRRSRREESHARRLLAASQHQFCWGYVSIIVKHKTGECEECSNELAIGDPCWWHPTTRAMRCYQECRPTHQTYKDNEIVVWHIKVGQYQQSYLDAVKAAREEEGERVLGVAWLAGEEPGYEPLDEVSGEIIEASPTCGEGVDGGEAVQGVKKRETSQLLPSHSEDVPSARKLTSKDELLARPFESVLEDLQKTLDYHVREAKRRSAGHFDQDDLRGAVYLKLVEAMRSFSGAGTFGGYLDVVIPNALVDYARKELPHEQSAAFSLDDPDRQESIALDPTEDWINGMEIRSCLSDAPNGDLLVLGAAGFQASELGPKTVIDMRRSRARTTLAEMLRTRGL